jgi:hypothetical protein
MYENMPYGHTRLFVNLRDDYRKGWATREMNWNYGE